MSLDVGSSPGSTSILRSGGMFGTTNSRHRPGEVSRPAAEWLGPRTAKAFAAAGLIDSTTASNLTSRSRLNPATGDDDTPSGGHRRYSLTLDRDRLASHEDDSTFRRSASPGLLYRPSSSQSHIQRHRPDYTGSQRSNSRLSSSTRGYAADVRGSKTTTSTSTTSFSISPSPSPQRTYAPSNTHTRSRSQSYSLSRGHTTRSDTTSPTSVSTRPSRAIQSHAYGSEIGESELVVSLQDELAALKDELRGLKDRHTGEMGALLAALGDSQRTCEMLRGENTELRAQIDSTVGGDRDVYEDSRLRETLSSSHSRRTGSVSRPSRNASRSPVPGGGMYPGSIPMRRPESRHELAPPLRPMASVEGYSRSNAYSRSDACSRPRAQYPDATRQYPDATRQSHPRPSSEDERDDVSAAYGYPRQRREDDRDSYRYHTNTAAPSGRPSYDRRAPVEERRDVHTHHAQRRPKSTTSTVFPDVPGHMSMLVHEQGGFDNSRDRNPESWDEPGYHDDAARRSGPSQPLSKRRGLNLTISTTADSSAASTSRATQQGPTLNIAAASPTTASTGAEDDSLLFPDRARARRGPSGLGEDSLSDSTRDLLYLRPEHEMLLNEMDAVSLDLSR